MDQLRKHVRALASGGMPLREITRRSGVSFGTVQRIFGVTATNVTLNTQRALMGVVPNART
jgi:transposase